MARVGLLNTKLGELHDGAGSPFDTDKVLSECQSAYDRILKNLPVKDLFTVALCTVFKFSMYVCMYVCRRIKQTEDRSDRSHNSRSRKKKGTEIKGLSSELKGLIFYIFVFNEQISKREFCYVIIIPRLLITSDNLLIAKISSLTFFT